MKRTYDLHPPSDPNGVGGEPLTNAAVAIVQSQWHHDHTDRMRHVCTEILRQGGVPKIDHFPVPGCYEIPLLAKKLARSARYEAIIVFGAIVRGDTDHYQIILDTCVRELGRVMYEFEVPIIMEILPVHSLEHLIERSTGSSNKGIEAAHATLDTIRIHRAIGATPRQ